MSHNRIERCRELLRTESARNGPAVPVHVSVALEAVLRRALLKRPDPAPERTDDEFDTSSFESAPGLAVESECALAGAGALCHS